MTEVDPNVTSGAMSLVDAHHHFQDLNVHYYPWLSDRDRPPQLEGDLDPIRINYLPADYARDVGSARVYKTVHVQNGWDPTDPVGETRWLQALAELSSWPTVIVAFADLSAPGVERVLEMHKASSAVRGIRQILNWHEDPALRVASAPDLMEQSVWRRGYALLRKLELSFDLQIYWFQMAQARSLAAAYPETTVAVNHFGMPVDRSSQGIADWARAMAHLAQAPNVVVKLSGLGLGHPRWTVADTVPLLKRTIETFGPSRVMVGTNLPVDRLFADGAKILGAIETAVRELSESERRAVLSGTAERVYRI